MRAEDDKARSRIDPVVKWPGGKRALIDAILAALPTKFGTYFEPFLGGGALFFALCPKTPVAGDLNDELINFYRQVAKNWEEIGSDVGRLPNDAPTYYRLRASRPRTEFNRALRFLYLNRTSFNGLYRTNQKGHFNVPFGHSGRAVLSDPSILKDASALLRRTQLVCQDFELTCAEARKGDLVYLDPPYTVAHENNGFLKYNAAIFSWDDQLRLKSLCSKLTNKGVRIILSNAAHSSIEELYSAFRIRTVQRRSLLSGKPEGRRMVRELLITNY